MPHKLKQQKAIPGYGSLSGVSRTTPGDGFPGDFSTPIRKYPINFCWPLFFFAPHKLNVSYQKILAMLQAINSLSQKYYCIVQRAAVAVGVFVRYAIQTPLRFAFLTYSSSRRRRRASLLALIVLTVCYYFNFPSKSNVPKRTSPTVKLLSSRLDFWGFHSTIDFPDAVGFNPSMLCLPWRGEDSFSPNFVVVAREEDQLIKVYDRDVRPRAILGSLLHVPEFHPGTLDRAPPREHPVLRASWVTRLGRVVRSGDIHFPKCDTWPEWFHGLQGPEDARIFWSSLGEPLLIYNSLSPEHSDLCRVMYMSDLRVSFPNVGSILSDMPNPAPIRFSESVPLLLPGQEGIQKNWVPFTDAKGDIFFHITLIPQHIYKLRLTNPIPTFSSPASDLRHFLEPVVTEPREKVNCLSIALPGQKVHQSSPFLDVILCTSTDVHSGLCDPKDPGKHRYMGIINVVHNHLDPFFYEGRILTLNYLPPFNYVSLSKPLGYSTNLYTSFADFDSGIGSIAISLLRFYDIPQQTNVMP